MNSKNIIENLKSGGHKNTKVRLALVEILQNASTPLSIQDILIKLKAKKLKPNKTTIYREIEFLTNLGLVSGVDFGEGKKRYERTSSHHHHIICVSCKKISDVNLDQDLDLFNAKIVKQAGFKPVGHSLEFFGLCQNCQS